MITLSNRRIPLIWAALVALAFVLGLLLAGPNQSTQADNTRTGYDNVVYEITAAGSNLAVRQEPNPAARQIDTLFWGDRVLWTGESVLSIDSNNWIKVGTSDGRTGWIVEVEGWMIPMNPVYTTPGMGRGAVISVTREGADSHCRAMPSSSSTEYRTMRQNDQAVVIGGPYQSEYWVWWQYRLASNYECWIVDIPGWFQVITPGTF